MRRIVIDSDIPFIRGVFEPYFTVEYLKGTEINRSAVADAAALITRTRTQCNSELLNGSTIKAIATATIGLDHIDQDYCRENDIEVFSAQGCNARAVGQWVFSAIRELDISKPYVLGIVGVGNVGREVEKFAREMGVEVVLCDPPRAEYEGADGFSSLEELLQRADVVTVHVPLTSSTRGMINSNFLALAKKDAVVMNASRGEVLCDEAALSDSSRVFVIDVWNNEPEINLALLEKTALATPHVAGYSSRGKARATTMCVNQLAEYFGIEELKEWDCAKDYALEDAFGMDIRSYDRALRSCPSDFEKLRTIR